MDKFLPNPKFYRSIPTWIFIIISLLGLILSCIYFNEASENGIKYFKAISQFVQFSFCIWVLTSRFQINANSQPSQRLLEEEDYNPIKKAIPRFAEKNIIYLKNSWRDALENTEEFRKLLILLWSTWAIYFAVSFTRTIFNIEFDEFTHFWEQIVEIIEVLLNNFTLAAFALCFIKLENPQSKVRTELVRPGFFIIIFITILHIFCIWTFFNFQTEVNSIFKLASGIGNAIVIAALTGRLESKNINPPSMYIWSMFLYSALQPLILISSLGKIEFNIQQINSTYFSISKEHVMSLAILRLWLLAIGKALFFLFNLWLLDSKRLINYFMITPELKKEGDTFDQYKNLL